MRRHLRDTLAISAVLVAGLLLAVAAQARPPHPPGDSFLEYHAEQLGLEPEQREAIAELVERSQAESEPLREQTHELRQDLHERLRADPPDAEAVMAQADALGAVETELHKLRLATMMGIHAVLTPEQRAQLKDLRGELRDFSGEELEEACVSDVAEFCPRAGDPLARAHCLRENRDGLSESCADALHCARRRHLKRGWGRFHRGPSGGPFAD